LPLTDSNASVPVLDPASARGAVEERDRLALILEIAQAASTLDLPELIKEVGGCLRRSHWQWEHTSLCLYEPEVNALRIHSVTFTPGSLETYHRKYAGGDLLPIEGTQSGLAFSTGEPCVVSSLAEYLSLLSPSWLLKIRPALPPAYSSIIVPLVCRGRRLGTLSVVSPRDNGCGEGAVDLLRQVASTVAPAVDNSLAYRRIAELKDRLDKRTSYLESEINSAFDEVLGDSPAFRHVLGLVESVAHTDSTVLLRGETGTGKELIARAIHRLSHRKDGPFVKINCAAIPTGLLESELFGHEKGAFTGAIAQRIGRFELATGGTLLLDEVGDIPFDLQSKLLRVLQEKEFERLGSSTTVRVDVRLIAATNRNLDEMIAQRSFRSDLYYRLNVFPVIVPPLRERISDIRPLVRHFVERSARRLKKQITEIPEASLAALARYAWPGNVRELENVIERSVILSPGPTLIVRISELAEAERPLTEVDPAPRRVDEPGPTLAGAERALILKVLDETGWVVGGSAGAAARLGISRTTLQSRMRKLEIARPRSRTRPSSHSNV
jgi:formate hydrogenlyase transcriptional activator